MKCGAFLYFFPWNRSIENTKAAWRHDVPERSFQGFFLSSMTSGTAVSIGFKRPRFGDTWPFQAVALNFNINSTWFLYIYIWHIWNIWNMTCITLTYSHIWHIWKICWFVRINSTWFSYIYIYMNIWCNIMLSLKQDKHSMVCGVPVMHLRLFHLRSKTGDIQSGSWLGASQFEDRVANGFLGLHVV